MLFLEVCCDAKNQAAACFTIGLLEKKLQSKIIDSEKILLVEDNLVNCEVAIDMLETIGIDVDVANNGRQALDLYDTNRYKLILMDCEMPVMDGYSATRHIRSRESKPQNGSAEKQTIPIIALTAHVMSSTREKCIASGMDDFLGKPFSLLDLKSILSKWLEANITEAATAQQQKSVAAQPVSMDATKTDWTILNYEIINKYYLKQQKDGSNLVNNIVNIYLDQSSTLLGDLTEAARNKDIESVRIISHTLKSSSENVGALCLAELCRNVEKTCTKGKIDEILVNQIYQNYSDVDRALKNVLNNVNGY